MEQKTRRRLLLSPIQRERLLALPTERAEIVSHYTLSAADIEIIFRHRRSHNRLGFAVQLCMLRYPGRLWTPREKIPAPMLDYIAEQVEASPEELAIYGEREQTRQEHLVELEDLFGWKTFDKATAIELGAFLLPIARNIDNGVALIKELLSELNRRKVFAPSLRVLERIAIRIRHRARKESYRALSRDLSDAQRAGVDRLLESRVESWQTVLGWIRESGGISCPSNILKTIEKLTLLRSLEIPADWAKRIHHNRLLQMSREGAAMTVNALRDLEPERRYATLVAVVLESSFVLTDRALEMHEHVVGKAYRKAQQRQFEAFQANGKTINKQLCLFSRLGKALIDARDQNQDPFAAVEALISWDDLRKTVEETDKLTVPESFDHIPLLISSYQKFREYAPEFLETFEFRAAPVAEPLLNAIVYLRTINKNKARKITDDAPMEFVRQRWKPYVKGDKERHFYEICALFEMRNMLRSGDLWVVGSRNYRDFDEYLLSPEQFSEELKNSELPINLDCEGFLESRSKLLHEELIRISQALERGELQDVQIKSTGISLSPLESNVPTEVSALKDKVEVVLPRVKITDLLVEIDTWTDFTRHFTHLRSGDAPRSKQPLLTAILADGINLGLSRMAEACPGTSLAKLSRVVNLHIREDTYNNALAELVNYHHSQGFTSYWGQGTTSSSDAQRFPTGSHGDAINQVNARYGNEPSVLFYTHVSDQYSPFYTKLISSTVRDATHVLDGLLYHETDLKVVEHYTDTNGFTDHVFALCHLLGFQFAPRIRNLQDTKLYTVEKPGTYPLFTPVIGERINTKLIRLHWADILRLALSIKKGTVTASLMLRKLGAYSRRNGLAHALRALGRLERSIFILRYIRDPEFRRRINNGLNKGELRNTLARVVFFNRLGEVRDKTFESQSYRASGLNLIVAAIVLWNTVYLEKAIALLRSNGAQIPENLLGHLSPIIWRHIAFTGDYSWKAAGKLRQGKLRPLRHPPGLFARAS